MIGQADVDRRCAGEISRALLAEETERIDLPGNVSIADMEAHAAEFLDDLYLLGLVGMDVPIVRVGDDAAVPVALSVLGLKPPVGLHLRNARRKLITPPFLLDYLDYLRASLKYAARAFADWELAPAEVVRESFLRGAADTLVARIGAARRLAEHGEAGANAGVLNLLQRKGGSRVKACGCPITVTSNTPGLRVFWSGAYFVSPNYFGHPTSPASGVLQAGAYIFGVDGGAYAGQVQWDTATTCALPDRPSVHLDF
jgi:hypothetical protein